MEGRQKIFCVPRDVQVNLSKRRPFPYTDGRQNEKKETIRDTYKYVYNTKIENNNTSVLIYLCMYICKLPRVRILLPHDFSFRTPKSFFSKTKNIILRKLSFSLLPYNTPIIFCPNIVSGSIFCKV